MSREALKRVERVWGISLVALCVALVAIGLGGPLWLLTPPGLVLGISTALLDGEELW